MAAEAPASRSRIGAPLLETGKKIKMKGETRMKKVLSVILALILCLSALVGCSSGGGSSTATKARKTTSEPVMTSEPVTTVAPAVTKASERKTGRMTSTQYYTKAKAALEGAGCDDVSSMYPAADSKQRFDCLNGTITVQIENDGDYVDSILCICEDETALSMAFQDQESLLGLLGVLAVPMMPLYSGGETGSLLSALLAGEQTSDSGVTYRITNAGDWRFALATPSSDEYIAIVAYYMGGE